MFRLFRHDKSNIVEVLPIQGLYTVQELSEYEFHYNGSSSSFNVFLEDIAFDRKLYSFSGNNIKSIKSRIFQDYFGFALLNIENNLFKFNIQIEKLKIGEIEDMLLFLWKNENRIFNNFLSKSSLKSSIHRNGSEFGLTSKYLVFVKHFYSTFKNLYGQFQRNPQYVLRSKKVEVDYTPEATSPESINWIFSNLDRIKFDFLLQNDPNSIKIENKYGYLDKIQSEVKTKSFSVYENEIILGTFADVIRKLKRLKRIIQSNVNIEKYSDSKYADFRDLKKIPLIKLYEDSNQLEKKLTKLLGSYKNIFSNTNSRIEIPKITPVFSSRLHYLTAFKTIIQSKSYKLNLDGELQLLNIRKLSQLYEAYNLHKLIEIFNNQLNQDLFTFENYSDRDDGIINRIVYQHTNFSIKIYYELKYPNPDFIDLVRIDSHIGNYYNPDYIIEFSNSESKNFYIIDSKYTQYNTLRNAYLNDSIYKYILNTGIINEEYKKINHLILLYPGHLNDAHISSLNHKPQISLVVSKPKSEEYFNKIFSNIIINEVPSNLLKFLGT